MRYVVIQRPAPPIAAAASGEHAARDEHAAAGGAGARVVVADRVPGPARPVRPRPAGAAVQQGQGADAGHGRGERRQQVERAGVRAGQRGDGGDRHEGDQQGGAEHEAPPGQDAGDAGEDEDAHQHGADQHGLVRRAELPDRPLLERRGRQVDDRGAHRQHRGGGGVGERGDQVGGGDADHRGQDAEGGVEQSIPHGWGSERRLLRMERHAVRQDGPHARDPR